MNVKELPLHHETVLTPTQPFNFTGTFHKPSHFPAPVDCFEDNRFRVTLRRGKKIYGINLQPTGRKVIRLRMRVFASQPISQKNMTALETEMRYRFGLDLDLSQFREVAEADPLLGPIERRWRGMRPSCAFSLYELLCITIVLQNAQVSRSVKMLQAMLDRYGERVRFDGVELFAFWPPSSVANADEEELRALKVGYRAKSFLRVSQFFSEHPDFEDEVRLLSKEDAGKRLRAIYGVGPATAWYLLFESLKHVDAFDHVSPWEQKILSRLVFDQEHVSAERILSEARKRWGEWRMLAIHYIFEDLFWRRRHEHIDWLDSLIRL